jgi:hypothetical protein
MDVFLRKIKGHVDHDGSDFDVRSELSTYAASAPTLLCSASESLSQ